MTFMSDRSIRKIPGVGGMLETTLKAMGIEKGQDLCHRAADLLIAFKESSSTFLIRSGLAIGSTRHHIGDEDSCQKGISVAQTFKPLFN
jgi:nucleotidyltransferase/DNA polymerase involved in DNA repair